MKNFINFIKYNNAFTFIVVLSFIAMSSTFAASPELRKDVAEAIISQKEKVLSLDNSKLLAQDFEKFDFKLQIKEIKENSENYYVKYSFRTFVIKDYVWQEDDAEKILSVSKSFLANKDLGLYTAQELGEVVDYNLSYLKETQEIEKKKGETNKVIAIEYGGLIGRFFDPEEKEFPGYQPVVEEKKIPALSSENSSINTATNQTSSVITPQSAADAIDVISEVVVIPDKETLRQMVQEAVREILENKTNAISSSSSNSSEEILSSSSSSLPAGQAGSTASSSSSAADAPSSSISSETASSSSDSFSSTSTSNSNLPAEASLSSAESSLPTGQAGQSSSQESSSDSSESSSLDSSSSSEPAL